MKLYMEDNNGIKIELKEIDSINKDDDVLLFILNNDNISVDLARTLEKRWSEKIGKKCIVVPSIVGQVIGIKQ